MEPQYLAAIEVEVNVVVGAWGRALGTIRRLPDMPRWIIRVEASADVLLTEIVLPVCDGRSTFISRYFARRSTAVMVRPVRS